MLAHLGMVVALGAGAPAQQRSPATPPAPSRTAERAGEAAERLLARLTADPHAPLEELALDELDPGDRAPCVAWLEEAQIGPGAVAPDVALALLAQVGLPRDLGFALRIAQDGGAAARAHLEDTVAAMLERDPTQVGALRTAIQDAPIELSATVVFGAARVATPEVHEALARLLGFDERLDRRLLPAIGGMGRELPAPYPDEVVEQVHGYLGAADPGMLSMALQACALLEDYDAIERMLRGLEHEEPCVQSAALWSLRQISGLRLPADVRAWRTWHAGERAWWAAVSEDAPRALADDDAAVAVRTLAGLAGHRFQRHRLARLVAIGLEHPAANVRRLACVLLGRVGSHAAVDALDACREDLDGTVAAAAEGALATLGVQTAGPAVEPDRRAVVSWAEPKGRSPVPQ